MSTATAQVPPLDLRQVRNGALVAGAAGLLLCGLGALIDLTQFFRSYLVAFCYVLGLAAGGLPVLMLQHLTGGGWGLVLRRPLEAAVRTLPLLVVFFLPVALGVTSLYPWTEPHYFPEDQQYKATYYLNIPFFLVRAAVCFAVWIGLAYFLNRMSRREDEGTIAPADRRFRLLSAPGIGLYGVTMTIAAIDWGMSLEPNWASTMYPPLWAFGEMLTAFAFLIGAVVLLSDRPPLAGFLNRGHLRDLGSLLLAFVMIWAYLAFSQYLLIWSGNLQEEITWYYWRSQGSWGFLAIVLILGHFALPFVLLLSADLKRTGPRLAAVAGLVLLMRYLDTYWVLMPAFDREGVRPAWVWLDLCAVVALGGFWLAFFLWQLGRMPLLPLHDPRLQEGNNHHD
jgi:hypothetical protein